MFKEDVCIIKENITIVFKKTVILNILLFTKKYLMDFLISLINKKMPQLVAKLLYIYNLI